MGSTVDNVGLFQKILGQTSAATTEKKSISSGQDNDKFEELLEKLIELSKVSNENIVNSLLGNSYSNVYASGICGYTGGVASGSQVSDELVNFIAEHEGFSATPYRGVDSQNRTIGYGHVIEPGENYTSLTQKQALDLLKKDLSGCVDSVNKEFGGYGLSQNQLDSLISFAYNLGENIWRKTPQLTSDIKAGASDEVLKADFLRINHVGNVEVKGLTNRRMDEWKLFTQGYEI